MAQSEVKVMEGPVLSTVYISSASHLLSDDELADIMRVSRENNLRDRITGMLLYRDGNIMQVLEGPEEKVAALIEKLRHDPRHHSVQVLLRGLIEGRQFEKWSMAFKKLDRDTPEPEGCSNFLDSDVAAEAFRSNPAQAYRLLLTFRTNIR